MAQTEEVTKPTLALKDFASALGAIIARLQTIVRIGDQLAIMKSLEHKTMAIVKQTVQCALFVQEYTSTGFCSRSVRNIWSDTDKKIDELINVLRELKGSFDGSLIVQGLFLSIKTLRTLEGLVEYPEKAESGGDERCLAYWTQLPNGSLSLPIPETSSGWLGSRAPVKAQLQPHSESLRGLERLGAFLFFDRNDPARSHPDGVIRTIAYSLALSNPHIAAAISVVIQRDPAAVNAPLLTQFKMLLQPLWSLAERVALHDLNQFHKLPTFIRCLITSRREADIDRHFRSRIVAKELDPQDSARDVEIFIYHEIDRIRKQRNLDPAWPEQSYLQELVSISGGLFIWASTTIRFIDSYRPGKRLKMLTSDSKGSTGLDSLYSTALRNSGPGKMRPSDMTPAPYCHVSFKWIPMTDKTIDMLLGSGSMPSAGVLEYFDCVIQWRVGAEARTLHASFADYLTDTTRSGGEPWAVDTKLGQQSLSSACLRILVTELRLRVLILLVYVFFPQPPTLPPTR
ncbi:hypothetical protein GGX14DRAFT_603899 [Mycena pura]|uniref:Uncharacterized protein n=1 Tax=Mycena pura TaxID=153505 RepID=A0AAD6UMW0_9AGAR|nr:hypothetical protein GGX14DRAFT_603899 [Mycena pura]